MKNLKITHIVNVTDGCIPNAFEGPKIKYLKIEISDLPGVQIGDNFAEFYHFLENAYEGSEEKEQQK